MNIKRSVLGLLNEMKEETAFRIFDGVAALIFIVVSFAVCYFGCVWLFPSGPRTLIAAVAGATAVTSGTGLFMAFRSPREAE